MKIAYLVLCHTDPTHIARLCRRLSSHSDIFLHVDKKADFSAFLGSLSGIPNLYFINPRHDIGWGSFRFVSCLISMFRQALSTDTYDRFIILQGADYPLKSDSEILHFFEVHPTTEFIRGCRLDADSSPYFRRKLYGYWFYNRRTVWARSYNFLLVRLFSIFPLRLRRGAVVEQGYSYPLYWGAAQFSVTGSLAGYIVDFYDTHPRFNHYFRHAFPCDEMYFHTIIFNSPYAANTQYGVESPYPNPDRFCNLTYFEYPDTVRVWKEEDYDFLKNCEYLYCRKVNSYESGSLPDLLDHTE